VATKAPARGRRRPPSHRKRTPLLDRVRHAAGESLAPHKGDVYGVALVALGILLGLAVYLHTGGIIGRGLDIAFRGLLGYLAFLLPPAVLLVGILMLAGYPKPERGRVVIGLGGAFIGLDGIVHLVRGSPTHGTAALQGSGGLLGAVTASPLGRLVSTPGAVVVFFAFAFLGVLIATKTPVRKVGEVIARGVRLLWRKRPGGSQTPAMDKEGPQPRRAKRKAVPAEASSSEVPAPFVGRPALGGRAQPGAREVQQLALEVKAKGAGYALPPSRLLQPSRAVETPGRALEETKTILEETLRQFEVDATVPRFTRGPTVTRFEVELGPAVKVSRVVSLSHDIAYALGTPDVRIIAPIPGRSAIGIEVPNRVRELVTLGDILSSEAAAKAAHPLTVALGKDIGGAPVLANLAEMPHLLIAGATGSGKSVCLNALVTSLLMRNSPDQVRMILIDPKRVEMTNYQGVPHLLTPVVTHPKRAAEALAWTVREMEMRLEQLASTGVRSIDGYNELARKAMPEAGQGGRAELDTGSAEGERPDGRPAAAALEPMPYIAVVVDELSDLMMVSPREVEDAICRIAQMARAVGIHLVVATQRPSVDVVTGLIKANIPSRIAFSVASGADSRVILDMGGADKLVGHGDMLFLPAGTSKPRRIQGAYLTETEVARVVGFCKAQQEAHYRQGIVGEPRGGGEEFDDDEDELLDQALDLVVRSGFGSTSMLQSKMKVGFSRARRIMDQLEDRGIVGPSEGSKPRAVLMTVDELLDMRAREAALP